MSERRLEIAGVPTAALIGGEGPPLVLLHGPGEFAGKWRRVLPELVQRHRVVAPDLPHHGASGPVSGTLDAAGVLSWLEELIERTCPSPPTLVGHVLGGAIAARFAIGRSDHLARLVLVDSLGLARFRPAPRFALGMFRFLARPSASSYTRFMRQCSFDLDELRADMGALWSDYAAYHLELARGPQAKPAGRLMRQLGLPRIPPQELARISAPTALIWGRQDRANRLRVAEIASARFGWPLHVVENCADDPPRDRPRAFLEALGAILADTRVAAV
ncbi:MAG TPA: alpha/beta fold hydrolase [Thermoanaerobaculia bacterium]|nr:alpha/beta fold hydrolase [Thermoanaerobaculia bacterium]